MTPKEKAVELYYNFSKCKDKSNSYFIIPIVGDAKQCALIAVDEIFEHIEYIFNHLAKDGLPNKFTDEIEYWQQVKKEIEKL